MVIWEARPRRAFTGWQLEYKQDAKEWFADEFCLSGTCFNTADPANANQVSGPKSILLFIVRWNKSVKRYQGFDPSQERYLSVDSDALKLQSPFLK